jgi:hypothetical protein
MLLNVLQHRNYVSWSSHESVVSYLSITRVSTRVIVVRVDGMRPRL